jgi:S1-C subfamily serine protease
MSPRRFTASLALAAILGATSLASAQTAKPRPPDPLPPAALPPLGQRTPVPSSPPAPPAPLALPAVRPLPEPRAPSPAAAGELRRISDALADIAERASPSVVQIDVMTGGADSLFRLSRREGGEHGLGSGVIFSSDGAVLTSNHVIEDARAITVRLRDGRTFAGKVAGRDPSTDLAVLRIDARGLPAASFADSDAARVGQQVLAIGSPFGLGHTVTSGVLSAKGRGDMGVNAVEDYLQTDASINPGNSGGPLIDLDGKVLGINTMIVARGQGIGLSVPSNIARRVADQILRIGRVDRAYVGLGLQDLTPQLAAEIPGAPPMGAVVNAVAPDGPAGRAHVLPGDVIAGMGGRVVRDAQDVIREVFLHNAGDTLPVEVVRAGKRVDLRVTLVSRGDPAPAPLPVEQAAAPHPGLGLSIRDVSDDEGNHAAQIVAVAPDSAADRAGVRAGDLVLEASGVQGPAAADVQRAAQQGHVLLRLRRQNTVFYTAVRR